MGIDDRPLPKPPVVKFAALVTTAAFAGQFSLPSFTPRQSFYHHSTGILLFSTSYKGNNGAHAFNWASPSPCATSPAQVLIPFRRFTKKWTTLSLHFGDGLLLNRISLDWQCSLECQRSSRACPHTCWLRVLMIHQCITTTRESPGMRVVLQSNLPLGREVPFKHLVLKMRVNVYKLPSQSW
jgi:hypothetical protein